MPELPTHRDFEDFAAWSGRDVLGAGGDRLGAVETIFLDEATGLPEWVLVSRDDGPAFVPLAGADVQEQAIRVDQAADRVAAAPRPDVADTLSVADEKRLYEHYGLDYSQAESSTVLPEGAATGEPAAVAPTGDAATDERPAAAVSTGETPTGEAPKAEAAETEPPQEARPRLRKADMAPRNLSSATPSPLPPPAPQVLPAHDDRDRHTAHDVLEPQGSRLRSTAVPVALASVIAALIALLVWRRRR